MIHLVLHGANWLLGYWLLVSIGGITFSSLNVHHSLVEMRSVRAGEKDEGPLRAGAFGGLVLHLAIGIVMALFVGIGLLLAVASFMPKGLDFDFSNAWAEALVLGVTLAIPTIPALFAFLVWLGRYWTIRALNGSK